MKKRISEIKIFHISGSKAGPQVLISAGVHGDEYEPMLATQRIIDLLSDKIIAGSVIVLPVVNVSAFLNGARTGSDGLDVARICPGNIEGSDSEIAAAQVSKLISQADYYIDLHTGGNLFNIMPLVGYMLHPSEKVLTNQRMMAKSFNMPVIWGTDSKPEGRTLSIARDHNIPAIYVEYGGGSSVNEKIINTFLKGCMNVLEKLEMLRIGTNVKPKWKYWLEDHTPDSGYLQSKMPSPATGIFIPEVNMGSLVQKGQKWGKVIDPINGNSIAAKADKEGMVLMTRVSAFVKEGESLGAILPVTKPGKSVINER